MKQTHEQHVRTVRKIERTLRERMEALSIKPKSKRGLEEQAAFLCGAMAALNAVMPAENRDQLSPACPPRWTISIWRSVPIETLPAYDPQPEMKDVIGTTVVGYFHGDKTRKSLNQKAERSDTK